MNMLDRFIQRLEEGIVAVGIAGASLVLFCNVVLRYGFNNGFVWAEEVARYTIVWLVFLGGSICVRRGMHLAVDALTVRMKPAGQRIMRIFVDSVCLVFCAFLVVCGKEMVDLAFEVDQLTAALEFPIGWVYLAIPVGGALMGLRFLQDLFRAVRGAQS
jgi:C4-dicarboxylate transporter DctQ subunit